MACFKEADRNSLSLGFFSIENFRSKLEFADKVINRNLVGKPLAADWAKLAERSRSAAKLRNSLVHRSTQLYPESKPGRRILLCPWIYPKPKKKTRIPTPPGGSLGLLDVVRYRSEFFALAISLMNFRNRVLGVQEQFPRSSEQAMDLPTIQMLVRLIHEELERPLKSSEVKS